ncbi:hypothetical protein BKA69DRAFT_507352 [Paraphysoderma sedebokerense]|nr:hypothetical protein BKA69DRAFT_507352 [Paraphysoderma sedebokerense]
MTRLEFPNLLESLLSSFPNLSIPDPELQISTSPTSIPTLPDSLLLSLHAIFKSTFTTSANLLDSHSFLRLKTSSLRSIIVVYKPASSNEIEQTRLKDDTVTMNGLLSLLRSNEYEVILENCDHGQNEQKYGYCTCKQFVNDVLTNQTEKVCPHILAIYVAERLNKVVTKSISEWDYVEMMTKFFVDV